MGSSDQVRLKEACEGGGMHSRFDKKLGEESCWEASRPGARGWAKLI